MNTRLVPDSGNILFLIAMTALTLVASPGWSATPVADLLDEVAVVVDSDGVTHISADNDLDSARAQGWVHARDRFFQMDVARRQASGDLSELLGPAELAADVQARTLGLRRAAQRTQSVLNADTLALLQAYADGVNAYLAANLLPPEYALLELTSARPWSVIDTLTIGKLIAASFSLQIDVSLTDQLNEYFQAGIANGFDGSTLFFEDIVRAAPIDPAATVPDAGASTTLLAGKPKKLKQKYLADAAAGARRVREKFSAHPLLQSAMQYRDVQTGSNAWGISGDLSSTGKPMIANDPHLPLNAPSTFYEWHLVVAADPDNGPMNVNGASWPGVPGVTIGQNEHVAWGATTNGLDVSDIFSDELHVLTPDCFLLGAVACIRSEGTFHPAEIEFATYLFNRIGDNVDDNLVVATLPSELTIIITVPFRSFGPVIDLQDPGVFPGGGVTTALTLQYTGLHATREIEAQLQWNRAANLADFIAALDNFDVGAQNWAYADVDGNLAYFSSGEAPLRKDLETGSVAGLPPAFVRDGSGPANWVPDPGLSQGQSIPFGVLPFDEMPQTINPANGFFVTANNDPAGTTLDNDPLNQTRVSNSSAIYYLAPSYANGLRAGRITRLIQERGMGRRPVSEAQMKAFQANTQQLDAELITPFLLQAFDNAQRSGAPTELADFADDAEVVEAIERIAAWDFSTPTGIADGYDASDNNGERRTNVSRDEQSASVAATIYNVWRGQALRRIIDTRLADFGLGAESGDALKALFELLSAAPFTGVGASGVDFFPAPGSLAATERRDVALLAALRNTLDLLASSEFAPAFAESTDQADYRWGRLHRITFEHEFEPAFSIPPAAGFENLSIDLPGLSRDGGYEVVNASGFSARADNPYTFQFNSGSARRYVGIAGLRGSGGGRVRGSNASPGGPSGMAASPLYATGLSNWLTADYNSVTMGGVNRSRTLSSETLVPAP